jgi:hypothetical protein
MKPGHSYLRLQTDRTRHSDVARRHFRAIVAAVARPLLYERTDVGSRREFSPAAAAAAVAAEASPGRAYELALNRPSVNATLHQAGIASRSAGVAAAAKKLHRRRLKR